MGSKSPGLFSIGNMICMGRLAALDDSVHFIIPALHWENWRYGNFPRVLTTMLLSVLVCDIHYVFKLVILIA